ncbi:cytochrome c biogenesis protein [Psychroflexus lacisalsi]|jgi:cytochrome c-type biogenesis protein CcsB|uniref:Cytochrome c biogenesis protein CcsA n=1 Tax=Psychroflexus lacisalsi TaxID=503928 RepID=A0ABN1K7B1_9FLAO|nr:cytochrome c biogenesis protein CcsA [Psychroflexus lacisalsi]MBZ9619449.1 cytochrome c biogenesis protein CcsA [Psychroflexus lacisalsi]
MLEKKIKDILFSTRLMAVLFIIYAVAMGVGTFIENSYTTVTAREWIYDAWWFEVIMVFFVINFIGNIFRYKLLRKKKWTTLLLHLSFILILVGAWVTRYIGEEGIMPIREGEVENTMLSEKTYLSTFIDGEIDGEPLRKKQDFNINLGPAITAGKTIKTDYNGTPVKIEFLEFIQGAEEGVVEDETGDYFLKIVEAGEGNRHDHFLKAGEVANIHNILFAFNKQTDGAINIVGNNEVGFTITSPFEGDWMRMADQEKGQLTVDSIQDLQLRSLYNVGGMQFVIPDPAIKGRYDLVQKEMVTKNDPDGIFVQVTANGETKKLGLLGGKGYQMDMKKLSVGDFEVYMSYGSKDVELPFALKLNDFIAKKHPGTEGRPQPSYESFMSQVEVVDGSNSYPYDIYMNHVLDHKGYRFFQSSFDPDEGGTILSVNNDWWGTWITYIGYFLLYLGMMAILVDRGSRFGDLRKKLDKIKQKKAKLASLFILLFGMTGFAQTQNGNVVEEPNQAQDSIANVDHGHEMIPEVDYDKVIKMIQANKVDKKHAAKFGKLIIQDYGGRMKPINTYSSELLRKLGKKDEYNELNSDQVLLSMVENPNIWYSAPLISIKAKNDSLHHVLGVKEEIEYVSLTDFFEPKTAEYKLGKYLDDAYKAAVPNQFQKDFITADEKVNLIYNTLLGKQFKIFPIPDHPNNKWVAFTELDEERYFTGVDTLYTKQILPLYMQSLRSARQTGDYEQSNELLLSLKSFQKKYGEEVMPAEDKVKAEILYNKIDIFNILFQLYLYVSLIMIVFVIMRIFKENKLNKYVIITSKVFLIILFIAHTAGLAARWYISGHAPWSNAYESMIYVAWATMFFGLAFGRKSDLTMGSTAFVTSIILMVAHWNWLDPSIGNLQPVLDSYWLMIHVAVIVGSYGPFALGAIIGLVSLILIIATNKSNFKKMKLNIQELTIINELALTVGLVMLTIGNFLGGQWANESWGRYWGWDPKETWALISIFVYAFVIHMRLVPGLRGLFAFNWGAVLAFGSILMTYFGVNFYLTGLHSYASGDQIISYQFIIIALVAWVLLGIAARYKYKKFY